MKENITIKGWDSDELRLIADVAVGERSTTVLLEPDFDEMSAQELEEYISRAEDKFDDADKEKKEVIKDLIDAAQAVLEEKGE